MANPEHVAKLREGVAAWNDWREQNPNVKPDLRDEDFSRQELDGINFGRANLYGADLNGASLDGANLSRANLGASDLGGATLYDAKLFDTNLARANLYGAALHRASLVGADLRGANLSSAYLISANLRGADLGDANLIAAELGKAELGGANLQWANFSRAGLAGTDMTRATLFATILADVDLSGVKGLEEVYHAGPSTVGIDTIFRSQGKIPEAFLRAAGVPEPFIVQMKALVGALEPIQFYSCFISYGHADKPFARALYYSLQGRGIRCWLDEKQLLPGDDIYEHVDRGIRLWDKVLLCCSEHSLQPASWVDREIITAMEKEDELARQRGQKVRALVPLNLDGYIFSGAWNSGYRAEIRRRLAADFTGWATDRAKFDEQVEKLIAALRADAGGRELPPEPRL